MGNHPEQPLGSFIFAVPQIKHPDQAEIALQKQLLPPAIPPILIDIVIVAFLVQRPKIFSDPRDFSRSGVEFGKVKLAAVIRHFRFEEQYPRLIQFDQQLSNKRIVPGVICVRYRLAPHGLYLGFAGFMGQHHFNGPLVPGKHVGHHQRLSLQLNNSAVIDEVILFQTGRYRD
ncbi:hypothetical protein D1872_208320 [compost metagenome]